MHLRYHAIGNEYSDMPRESSSNLGEMTKSILERKFTLTKIGREYLTDREISETELFSCGVSFENSCKERGMLEGVHYTASEIESVGAKYYKQMTEILAQRSKEKKFLALNKTAEKYPQRKGFNKKGRPKKSAKSDSLVSSN